VILYTVPCGVVVVDLWMLKEATRHHHGVGTDPIRE
jgi:hypothetical protein